ncbi:MAG TPA: hypothetical protein VL361_10405 [Candidatus Limnocylindrales bacterium]|nr:hypothetical protein [Candidatus Limnocylindrales bacterium]
MSTEVRTLARELIQKQGLAVYMLRSRELELAVVPELGARIISLRNIRTGREWMWHPEKSLKLFRNRLGDDFCCSTLAGTDECLPTIAACSWNGRTLPDHGEVWSAAWKVDESAWQAGALKTWLELPISPFEFERTIQVKGSKVRMSYLLTNLSRTEEKFLWALHPLLQLRPGDRLNLPPQTRALLKGDTWIDGVDAFVPQGGCAKTFARPLSRGFAEIANAKSGDRLIFDWDPAENNTLGLWLTRGGWNGHHHFAIEPTNGAPDALSEAAQHEQCGRLTALGSTRWSVTLQVAS